MPGNRNHGVARRITIIQGPFGASEARRRFALLGVLSMLPMSGALLGAALDERLHFGLSNWRSACRAAGFAWSSVLYFTFELLPTAIIGTLVGGLLVQSLAFLTRRRGDADRSALRSRYPV